MPIQLSYIGTDLGDNVTQTWIPDALSLVEAVVSPIISSASDTFQIRKELLVVPSIIAFIGAAIAPGATSLSRVIVAQTLIGFGFSTVALAYSVPSEILPRKWRPSTYTLRNVT
jgi:predicted MFS family arabinose efflux permease